MQALSDTKPNLYGVFEISDEGTILYSRRKNDADKFSFESLPQIVGRNFFSEIAEFENVEEFRLCVKRFVKSDSPSKSFIFNCRINGLDLPVRILLVRVTDRVSDERSKLTIVDIREI